MTGYGAGIAILVLLLIGVIALAAGVPGLGRGRAAWPAAKRFAAAHYVEAVVLGAGTVVLASLALGLWRVFPIGVDLLGQLREVRDDAEAARAVVIALAAALAAIGILGAIVVGAIRVWTSERQIAASERQTATIEQGHVTDRLTKAVEQLGAEKTAKRVLRDADGAEVRDERNVPITVETTEPNLEVRLGAIYALERIGRDSARDHVTIMEILCAYVRENAKARDAPPPLEDMQDRAEGESADARESVLREHDLKRDDFFDNLRLPRVDVQATLTVIGRRDKDRTARERSRDFRLDLRETNLCSVDLSGLRLDGANLFGARLEGADLDSAQLEGADLSGSRLTRAYLPEVRLERAYLEGARLERANLFGAHLEGANLGNARLEKAHLAKARLESAGLIGARLEGANLNEAWLMGADLTEAWLDGAELIGARLEGAQLVEARLEGTDLRGARLEGADLRYADFRGSNWAGASARGSPAQFADFRGCQSLKQAQLHAFVGNDDTLLPDWPNENGEPYYVWSCWNTPPPEFEATLARAPYVFVPLDQLRAEWLCGPSNPRRKVGTPLALDAPYPEGHPLAGRD